MFIILVQTLSFQAARLPGRSLCSTYVDTLRTYKRYDLEKIYSTYDHFKRYHRRRFDLQKICVRKIVERYDLQKLHTYLTLVPVRIAVAKGPGQTATRYGITFVTAKATNKPSTYGTAARGATGSLVHHERAAH